MLFVFVRGRCIEPSPHIAIAKTVDGILASVDRCHQLGIGFPHRIERSMPLLLAPYWPTHLGRFLRQRAVYLHRRQRRQMPIGRFAAHFDAPTKIGHAAPQHAPLLLTLWLILRSAPYPKVLRLVDRHLVAQHTALVIKLQRILVEPVLDPHSLTSPPPIRHHRVIDADSPRPPHVTHHLLGSHMHHCVMNQWGVDPLQRPAIAKHHIAGIFALGCRPVILPLYRSANFLVQRMTPPNQLLQHLRPIRSVLLLHQLLRPPNIGYPRKTVVLLPVGHPLFVHLPP